jgi:hypothetical protein
MKNYILILFLSFFSINILFSQIPTQKFRIKKIEYLNEKGLVCVKFNLVNITGDTLYLSNKNLNIKLIKNNKTLKWEYPKVDVQPFIKPVLKNVEQMQIKPEILNKEDPKEKLATHFASKLFLKNVKINDKLLRYRDRIIQNIIDDCIVLLPSETYEYETYLFSKKFDKTCKVSVKYSASKRLTYFVNDSGKRVDIND